MASGRRWTDAEEAKSILFRFILTLPGENKEGVRSHRTDGRQNNAQNRYSINKLPINLPTTTTVKYEMHVQGHQRMSKQYTQKNRKSKIKTLAREPHSLSMIDAQAHTDFMRK